MDETNLLQKSLEKGFNETNELIARLKSRKRNSKTQLLAELGRIEKRSFSITSADYSEYNYETNSVCAY